MLIAIIAIALICLYYYNVRNFDYWKKRGVKHDKPILFFGTNSKNFLLLKSRSEITEEMYFKYPDEKVVGFFRSTTPELITRDPEIIKKILISDFSYFYGRGFHPYKQNIEKLIQSLFFVEGDLWKMLRIQMTPAFTSGKLKAMFPLIVERAESLQQRTLLAVKKNLPIDARELMARFTTDFIGACGFGLDSNSINDDNSDFRRLGRDVFNPPLTTIITSTLKMLFPVLFKDLKFFGHIEKRSFDLVNKIQQSRNYKPIGRNDFVDQLLYYKQKGPIEIESMEKLQATGKPEKLKFELTNDLIVAQVILFFSAGFETSSSATSYTLHELAFHPEIQKKVQNEIDEVLKKHDNKLSYAAVKEMTYLEWTFKEAMRIFPSLGYLMRECTRKYTFEDLGFSIDEGVKMMISVAALHRDPKYWHNPEEFRPERFSNEEFTNVQKDVYLAFGDGPRVCIGARLGLMQSLAGLAAILSKFSVTPAPETVRRPPVVPTSDIVQNINGIPLMFHERH
ncbi:unnamed protein product [Diatraea saccharalis]|uniref:unspecific monooxygenase n=1 Tax=Diatraea saccharalis TaxID=40085 RepID=A0A9N9RA47_9NEOP|nr:unnamed protein product [Diatraea saccharalis]